MESALPEPPREQSTDTNQHQPLKITSMYPTRKGNKFLYVSLFILLALGLGYGAYKVGSKKPITESNEPVAQQTTAEPEKDVADAPETKEFENGFLGIKLTYPSNWTVTEPGDRSGVRFESPEFSYQTTTKGVITGNFRVYARKGARTVDGGYIGRGYAIEPSTKLVYTAPAPGQRPDTNLSLFGLDTPDNFAFFLIAGNFELNKGDTLGPNYGKEAETYIITGGFSAKDLADDLATNPVSPEIIKTSNAYKQAIEILKSLQLR